MKFHRQSLPPAVVLSCEGCASPALNVVQALGEKGVPVIVVSEDADALSAASRYCVAHRIAPPFSRHPDALADLLAELGGRYGGPLPVFPTADPDLHALIELSDRLPGQLRSTLGDTGLIRQLIDKDRFRSLADTHGLPVPRTWAPADQADVAEIAHTARFPLLLKPAFPFKWPAALAGLFADRKALLVHSAAELRQVCATLAPPLGLLVQDYVAGADEAHHDVHVFIDARGQVQGTFAGRKWRIHPVHAGSGCFVQGMVLPALEQATADLLLKIGFRGIANVNYKQDAVTGEFMLLEINARVSQWGILTTRSGLNLPWLAYCDSCGIEPGRPPQRRSMYYLDPPRDLRAFRMYRRTGEWSTGHYLRSLVRQPMAVQSLSWGDPWPALRALGHWLVRR